MRQTGQRSGVWSWHHALLQVNATVLWLPLPGNDLSDSLPNGWAVNILLVSLSSI